MPSAPIDRCDSLFGTFFAGLLLAGLPFLSPATAQADACSGGGKPKIVKACRKVGGKPRKCDPRLRARPTLFPAALVPLRCGHWQEARKPAWICRTVQLLSRQQRCQCANPKAPRTGANPYAETALMRHAVKLPLTPEEHKALIAASISQDAELVLQYTAPLRAHPRPDIRYAATLIAAHRLAKISLRQYRREIHNLVAILQQLKDKVDAFPTSDADFLAALLAMDAGDDRQALQYLDAALAQEPAFFNAAVLAVKLQLQRLARNGTLSTGQCLREYNTLAARLAHLVALNPCPRMAAHVEVYLSRWFAKPQKVAPLAAARIYLSIMAWDVKRAQAALARYQKLSGHNACTAIMSKTFQQFITIAEAQLKAQ